MSSSTTCTIGSNDRSSRTQADALQAYPDYTTTPSLLAQLPPRSGTRPDCEACLPHAQMTQQSPDDAFERWKQQAVDMLGSHVTIGKSTVSMPSTFPAFHLVCSPTTTMPHEACMTPGGPLCGTEFAHLHTRYFPADSQVARAHEGERWQSWQGGGQGSMHVCLSLQDAAHVLEQGWGERHVLAGNDSIGFMVPRGLVLLYAPRDEQEIEVASKVLEASLQFARGRKGAQRE